MPSGLAELDQHALIAHADRPTTWSLPLPDRRGRACRISTSPRHFGFGCVGANADRRRRCCKIAGLHRPPRRLRGTRYQSHRSLSAKVRVFIDAPAGNPCSHQDRALKLGHFTRGDTNVPRSDLAGVLLRLPPSANGTANQPLKRPPPAWSFDPPMPAPRPHRPRTHPRPRAVSLRPGRAGAVRGHRGPHGRRRRRGRDRPRRIRLSRRSGRGRLPTRHLPRPSHRGRSGVRCRARGPGTPPSPASRPSPPPSRKPPAPSAAPSTWPSGLTAPGPA